MKTIVTRLLAASLAAAILFASAAACRSPVNYSDDDSTVVFIDSAGREVELLREITRVAPSGVVATMILAALCPEYMVCKSDPPASNQVGYLPERLLGLPEMGQLYGSKSTLNLESLLGVSPQVIIDLGDRKDNIGDDMDKLQETTGIATVYIEADLPSLAAAYRVLGDMLGLPERGEELASFIDETLQMAAENCAKIADGERKTVMYTTGTSGLGTNAAGSVHAKALDIVGAINAIAVEDVSNAGGGNVIDLEQLYNFDPDIILFTDDSIYSTVAQLPSWADLSAIKNGSYYEIPGTPYNWMSHPPSINMVLGIWWCGNLLYPEIYDYDMVEVTQKIFDLFWGYELTESEARAMLASSTLKYG